VIVTKSPALAAALVNEGTLCIEGQVVQLATSVTNGVPAGQQPLQPVANPSHASCPGSAGTSAGGAPGSGATQTNPTSPTPTQTNPTVPTPTQTNPTAPTPTTPGQTAPGGPVA
jgi:hypothetical protein